MKTCLNTYYVTVIEDTLTSQIVGSATLVVEQKFIHECAVVSSIHEWTAVKCLQASKEIGPELNMSISHNQNLH